MNSVPRTLIGGLGEVGSVKAKVLGNCQKCQADPILLSSGPNFPDSFTTS